MRVKIKEKMNDIHESINTQREREREREVKFFEMTIEYVQKKKRIMYKYV